MDGPAAPRPPGVEAVIGLGGNLGDRRAHLTTARRGLAAAGPVVASSSLYETAPVGGPPQGPYLNAVVVVATNLAPLELFDLMLRLERAAGRERRERWGPRPLDLDLLLYGAVVVATARLTVPHPRLRDRRFVLEPLLEVRPGAVLPDGRPLADDWEAVVAQEARRVAGWGQDSP